MRARCHIEELRKDREAIIVTEIPYQVNKATMIERIASWCATSASKASPICATKATATACASSSSSSATLRPKSCSTSSIAISQLQTTFGVNMLALNGGRPQADESEGHDRRLRAVPRRGRHAAHALRARQGARPRAHILVGLAVAVANIDEVIALIRAAPDAATAAKD
jgi:DNA gyrase subunit A